MEKYDLTHEAAEDLYKIWEYTIDTWSEEQADKYYGGLRAAFLDIATRPEMRGKPYDIILPGLRGYHVGRHIIFYTRQLSGRVLIIRILHEKMDFSMHL